jgi:membrane protein YdbS with pleckstrin-like domain
MEPMIYKVSGIWMSISIAFWLAAGVFASFTVIVPLIAVIMVIRALLLYLTTEVSVDDGGVTLRQGVITKQEKRFPIGNIHSVSTSVGPLAAQFDYGTLSLSVGNDRSQLTIRNLAGCQDLKQRLEPIMAK